MKIGQDHSQPGGSWRAVENDEKFIDLPRWITLFPEQNLYDNAIQRGVWKNSAADLPDLIEAEPRYLWVMGEVGKERWLFNLQAG